MFFKDQRCGRPGHCDYMLTGKYFQFCIAASGGCFKFITMRQLLAAPVLAIICLTCEDIVVLSGLTRKPESILSNPCPQPHLQRNSEWRNIRARTSGIPSFWGKHSAGFWAGQAGKGLKGGVTKFLEGQDFCFSFQAD